jgi:hypothetical protein
LVPETPESTSDEVPEKIVRLAIGVDGGFKTDAQKIEYDDYNSIVTLPNFDVFPIGN